MTRTRRRRAEAALRRSDGHWKRLAIDRASVIAMVRAMIGEMFGPIASIESEEATFLRGGPDARYDGEAILEALARVRDVLDRSPPRAAPEPLTENADAKGSTRR